VKTAAHDRLFHQRLFHQRLRGSDFRTAAEVVAWLGAVQSQDFAGATWALGLRARGLSRTDVEREFNAGTILRTHILRPTWHFVAPSDIRGWLALTAPRVIAVSAPYYRQHQLDDKIFARSQAVFARALQGGHHLTRTELSAALAQAGIAAAGPRLALLMMRAELDAVICSGPRQGKQFTYALLEQRVPRSKTLTRDDALDALTRRYFTSHGPATVRDYAWWSGLGAREARTGIDLAKEALVQTQIGDHVYWWIEPAAATPRRTLDAHLLPNYDEYLIAYQDREPVLARHRAGPPAVDALINQLVIDGRLAGSWKRTTGAGSVVVDVKPDGRLTRLHANALSAAIERYQTFIELPVVLRWI
jgi:hypothetical protein